MSLDRQHGRLIMYCDYCGDDREDEDDMGFELFINGAKRDGWTIRKSGSEWLHSCPDCNEDGA